MKKRFISKIKKISFGVFSLSILYFIGATLLNIVGDNTSLKSMYNARNVKIYIVLYFEVVAVLALGILINDIVDYVVKDKRSNIYNVFEKINALCVLFVGFVGLFCLGWGVMRLYNTMFIFIPFITISAFVIFYWYKKEHSD